MRGFHAANEGFRLRFCHGFALIFNHVEAVSVIHSRQSRWGGEWARI